MLITPPVVAVAAAGPHVLGLMAILGWFFAYCLRGPLEALQGSAPTGRAGLSHAEPAVARFWLVVFGLAAAALLGPVVYRQPSTLALLAGAALLLLGVKALADRGQTRSIAAGMLAILGLMAGGPLYYLAAAGSVTNDGWTLTLACGAFFIGSVFRVKTLAREKRARSFRLLSVAVHLAALLPAVAAVPLAGVSPLLPVALVLPLAWAIYGAVRAGAAVSLLSIGRGEQWLTVLFGLLLLVALRVG
jgi:hypothetical protein